MTIHKTQKSSVTCFDTGLTDIVWVSVAPLKVAAGARPTGSKC